MAGARAAWQTRAMSRLRAWLLVLAVLPLAGWEPLWRHDPDVAEGNRAYAEQRYDDALAAYDRAAESGVDPHGLDYDRGAATLAKAEAAPEHERAPLYAEAMKQLENATRARDKAVRARAHYNRGNIHMRGKHLDEAIEEYKDALRADPTLEAARSNLELALRQREKQRQQQQQQGQGQGQPQQGQGQPQPQQGQGQGQPQPNSQGQAQGAQPQQGQQGNQGQPQPRPNPGQQGQQPQPGQQPGQQGQQGQNGQGQPGASQRRMPQMQWPRDDTESDTPDTAPSAKLDQLEDMSRQLRRDQVRQRHDASGDSDRPDW
jgi:tetratricopeptide (TPR) repeat protein